MDGERMGQQCRRPGTVTLGLNVASLAGVVVALVGLFQPFVNQNLICPPGQFCALMLILIPNASLYQGLDGLILVSLLSAATLAGLIQLLTLRKAMVVAGLLLTLAAISFVTFDALFAWARVFHAEAYVPANLDIGFYLALLGLVGSTLASLLLLAGRRGSFRQEDGAQRSSSFGLSTELPPRST